jgi:hypothetical protein
VSFRAIFEVLLIYYLSKETLIFTVFPLQRIARTTRCVNFVNHKAIPLQALTGLEGSRRLRLPDFKKIGT